MNRQLFLASIGIILSLGVVSPSRLTAQQPDTEPVVWTTAEDHQNMMKQLGITRLRPGPSGNPDDPNAANTDESLANRFDDLPPLMILNQGERVTTAAQWQELRRPEIVEDFEREVVGRVPSHTPDVRWEIVETRKRMVDDISTIEHHIVGTVDNQQCPSIEVRISLSVTLPENSEQPVPVLMMFGWTPFDPAPPWFRQREGEGRPEDIFIRSGWGYAKLNPNTVQDDAGGFRTFGRGNDQPKRGMGLTRGIIGLCNHGQPRSPEDWGALRAWAWGASRALDYLSTIPEIDDQRVGIEGVSRYGKAALVTMAFDPRFHMVLVGSAGEGGASLYRRDFGETVENLAGSGEYHWMAGNFLKYAAAESEFGEMTAQDLPVDAHQLIALCAPRLTFISYGIPARGDALWLDQPGSFMATIAAQPAFRLLGAKGLGRSDDYRNEPMPAVNEGLLDGHLAWRQHDGGHTDIPNYPHFIQWVEKHSPRPTAE